VLAKPITGRYRDEPRDATVAGPILRQVIVLRDCDVGADAGGQCQTVIEKGARGPELSRGTVPARLNMATFMNV